MGTEAPIATPARPFWSELSLQGSGLHVAGTVQVG